MTCRCAPALLTLRDQVNLRWPNRDKTSDGCCGDPAHASRKSDHNPTNGFAHAIDIDEHIAPNMGDQPLWPLAEVLMADIRCRYVIYEARILYPDGTDKAYTGPNAHKHHLHLSIKTTATHDTRLWRLPTSWASKPAPSKEKVMYLYRLGIGGHPDEGKVFVTDLLSRRYVDDGAEEQQLQSLLGATRENWMTAQLHDSLKLVKV